jgi:hypothetical protein
VGVRVVVMVVVAVRRVWVLTLTTLIRWTWMRVGVLVLMMATTLLLCYLR